MSREEAAARLHVLADMLARDNDVEFERDGIQVQGPRRPTRSHVKVELEVETDERELEIELKW